MEVRFSKRALKFIQDKEVREVFVCLLELDIADSIGATKDVHVCFEVPDEEKQFHSHKVEGIEVHVDTALKVTGPVVIKRQGIWKLSSLYADGLQVPL
jgi:hypothetical protein